MKPIISNLLLGACVIASGVVGQTKQTTMSLQNPEQVGVIHSVEADGSLKSLEECAGQFHSSGSGGVTIAFLACRNPKSSVRLKAGTPLEFQVRLHKDNLNKKYSLYAVATKGDLRAFYVAAPPRGPRLIPTTATRTGELLRIKTARPLPAGEYIFVTFTQMMGIKTIIPPDVYLFRIDPPV